MSDHVKEGTVPGVQMEGMAPSAVIQSVPKCLINRCSSSTAANDRAGSASAGQPHRSVVSSPGPYRDPCAAVPPMLTNSEPVAHRKDLRRSHTPRGGSFWGGQRTAVVLKKKPTQPLTAAAQTSGNGTVVGDGVVCSTSRSIADSSVRNGDARNKSTVTGRSITHLTSLRRSSDPSASSATTVGSVASTSALVEKDRVLCVELADGLPQDSSHVSSAVYGERLDLRKRGLVALPCLHARAAFPPTLPDARDQTMTLRSAHRSGDVLAGRLRTLSFRENVIESIAASQTLCGSPLECYTNVSTLDLTHNALTSIAGIEALRCLRSLRLAFNRITSLAPLWASQYVADLDVLDVSSNNLTELISPEDINVLGQHCVEAVPHPERLPIPTSDLNSVEARACRVMQLRVLYASDNRIREVPSAMYIFKKLTDLRLRKNLIDSVPEGFPERAYLPQLSHVDLSMNKLPASVAGAVTARMREGGAGLSPVDNTKWTIVPPLLHAKGPVVAFSQLHLHTSDLPPGETAICSSSSASMATRDAESGTSTLTKGAAVDCTESDDGSQRPVLDEGEEESGVLVVSEDQGCRAQGSAGPAAGMAGPSGCRCTHLTSMDDVANPLSSQIKVRCGCAASRAHSACSGMSSATLPDVTSAASSVVGQEAPHQDAIQRVAENAYSIDIGDWAAMVRQRLEQVLQEPPAGQAGDALDAQSPRNMREHLLNLSNTLASQCSGGAPTAQPRDQAQSATVSRMAAALNLCLPSGCLVFSEDAQGCCPLLLLTGITAAAATDQSGLLLHEVVAHHIVQNCLQTAKTSAGGESSPFSKSRSSCQASGSAESPQQQLCQGRSAGESVVRSEASATDYSKVVKSSLLRSRIPARGRGGGAPQPLSFSLPLQVIHVIDCTDSVSTAYSTTSVMWAYITWRQRWESAVSRRRFACRNTYVCQIEKQNPPIPPPQHFISTMASPTAALDGDQAHAVLHHGKASNLYPFTANSPVPRVLEWRRLQDHRPASYYAVPFSWEILYDLLLCSSPSQRRDRTPGLLPLLHLESSSVSHKCSALAHLACAQILGADSGGLAQGSSVSASPSLQLLRRPPSGTDNSTLSCGSSGTQTTALSSHLKDDIIIRALQWRRSSQQLSSCVESEASTVATEQVTKCDIPLYSSEEVLQSQQAAVIALSSPDSRHFHRKPRFHEHSAPPAVALEDTIAFGGNVLGQTPPSPVLVMSPSERRSSTSEDSDKASLRTM